MTSRASIGYCAINKVPMATNQGFINLIPNHPSDADFVLYSLVGHRRRLESLSSGSTFRELTKSSFASFEIGWPTANERRAIVFVLGEVDSLLSRNRTVVEQAKRSRKTLVAAIFARQTTKDWPYRTIGSVVAAVQKPVVVKPDTIYREIGIRSHGKGIFHKHPVLGAKLGNKRVFHIEPGCLVLNIVFAWENAVAITSAVESGMIASHRFPMFRPNPSVLELEYLKCFVQSPRGVNLLKMVSPGGAGRNKTLNQGDFLRLHIPVPSLKIQQKIIAAFDAINACIKTEEAQIAVLERIQIELARRLLTGELRVKA